jgi:hypothetical protein
MPDDFTTVAAFGNHAADPGSAPRGGDLWIRCPGGAPGLTEAAGLGMIGLRARTRSPCAAGGPLGSKVVFSMIVRAPASTIRRPSTGSCTRSPASASPHAHHTRPEPAAGLEQRLSLLRETTSLFASDRPRDGSAHLTRSVTVRAADEHWALEPRSGDRGLFLMQHSPSAPSRPASTASDGVFTLGPPGTRPTGRRRPDQHVLAGSTIYGTFNWSDESPASTPTTSNVEVFPDPRNHWVDFVDSHPAYSGDMNGWSPDSVGNTFNHFFPWQINQDGTEEETIGHVGRHELHHYFNAGRDDDPNVVSFLGHTVYTANPRPIDNFFQIREDPNAPGDYFGIDAPDFTLCVGKVIRLRAP